MDVVSKKITLLISSLAGGGAEGVCVNVANGGLAECGWQVDLVILHTNNAAYLERVSPKVNLVVLGVNHARIAPFPLLPYIRKHKPAKLLVFNYELAVIAVMLRSVFRFKTKIIARNINTFSQSTTKPQGIWRGYIVTPLINHFYGKCDHIINQCQAMRDDLVSVFPHLADKTSVIYNPVAKHVEDYAKTHDLTQVEKQDYLLCVGRLEKQKAFHYAIEGFAGIANHFPNLRLKIVGQGSLEQSLKQCAQDFGVTDRVDFEGFQADMIPYYLHAKATLLTSLYEGFPNVLIESITLGTPIIAFDCKSGPNEIVIEGVNGHIVKENDFIRFGAYFWNTDRCVDLLFRYKESVNAGRAFIFCQLNIPFIACPIPEVVSIFGPEMEDYFPYTKETWSYAIRKLASNKEERLRIKKYLKNKNKNDNELSTCIESRKLKSYILEIINDKKR